VLATKPFLDNNLETPKGQVSSPARGDYRQCLVLQGLPCGGRSCRKCLTGVYQEADSPLYLSNYHKSAECKVHKQNRFLVKAFRGVECGSSKGFRFRWFVLTESDEAILDGIEFAPEFHRLITWLRYSCPDFQYILVEHMQGEVSKVNHWWRRNWHILSYGTDKLPVLAIREYWLSHFKSTITGLAEIRNIKQAVMYVSGYLSADSRFVKSSSSFGWIYRGWQKDSLVHKRNFGEYLSPDLVVKLSHLKGADLAAARECVRETGFLTLAECFSSSCEV